MARLFFYKGFEAECAKLEQSVRRAVEAAIDKFSQHTWAGLRLKKVQGSRDHRMRTIRINRDWRGVVLAPDSGDSYLLLTVRHHQPAYEYARRHRVTVNQALGTAEVRDEQALDERRTVLQARVPAFPPAAICLFAHVSDGELKDLGVDSEVIGLARRVTSIAELEELEAEIPEWQYFVLRALADGVSVQEVWESVAQELPDGGPRAEVDTGDLVAALERTPDRFAEVSVPEELREVLGQPFIAWRRFLHPSQRTIAYHPSYAGPVQVTGGAGTGKTVTLLHRAAFLARQSADAARGAAGEPPILLTTFTRGLRDALSSQLAILIVDDTVRRRVEILHVDELATRVVRQTHKLPEIADRDNAAKARLEQRWADAGADAGLTLTPRYLLDEWEQVILAQDLTTEEAYLTCQRTGRGTQLTPAQRRQVWHAAQRVTAELQAAGASTYFQLANEAAHLLRESGRTPYRHVIVDEGQDLHASQWRLLRAAVVPGPDDMMIAADPNQRIYENQVSLARLGISVRGRSHRLLLSYRTTQRILAWAVPLLGSTPVTGLDDEVDSLRGYFSPVPGEIPEVRAATTREEEIAALIDRVRAWQAAGIEPHAIAVATRSNKLREQVREALKAAGILPQALTYQSTEHRVRVGTMHGMKGLEFQAVAAVGVEEGTVPAPYAATDTDGDPLVHALDLQRERCVLFVACTRARDHLYVSYTGKPSPFLPA